jgi:TIR domain
VPAEAQAGWCDTLQQDNVAKPTAREHYRVFFSHSHKDRWIAKQCVRLIEDGAGGRVSVFLDERDIEFGQSIGDSVRENIELCDEFLVLFSRYSKDRPWVLAEMGAAWGLRKPIIVIVDKVGPNEMPDMVNPYKPVDLNEFDEYLKQLLKRVRAKRSL